MVSLKLEKLQEYCRLCQENLGTINILENDEFVGKVYQCSNIKLNDEKEQGFPKSVCKSCRFTVEEMCKFIKQIQLIDLKLRRHFVYLEQQIVSDCDKLENKGKVCQKSVHKKYSKTNIKAKENFKKRKGSSSVCDDDKTRNDVNKVEKSDVPSSTTEITTSNTVHTEKDAESCENQVKETDHSDCELTDNDLDDNDLTKVPPKNLHPCTYDNCSKVCSSSYTLRTHLMKHEGKTPFLCVTCGKGFRTKNSLNSHEKIHAKVKAYECTECNIRFSISSNLRAHQRKHHEGIRYYCSQCPLVYVSKYSVERHELVHTGVKEYKCDMCKAAFYTNKELTKHQRYHQGLRLYKCEQCFKTFFEKHHLTIHIRCHTGERPYACKIAGCGKSFRESQKLKRHLKARHPLI